MKPSKVFFTDFHATPIETLPQKLHRLMKRADAEWEAGLIHAEEIGLGTRQYELIRMV